MVQAGRRAYLKIPLALLPLASGCVLLMRLGAILSSGPRKRSMKESGRSSSSNRLLCAHSLSLTTRLTSLTHTHTEHTSFMCESQLARKERAQHIWKQKQGSVKNMKWLWVCDTIRERTGSLARRYSSSTSTTTAVSVSHRTTQWNKWKADGKITSSTTFPSDRSNRGIEIDETSVNKQLSFQNLFKLSSRFLSNPARETARNKQDSHTDGIRWESFSLVLCSQCMKCASWQISPPAWSSGSLWAWMCAFIQRAWP